MTKVLEWSDTGQILLHSCYKFCNVKLLEVSWSCRYGSTLTYIYYWFKISHHPWFVIQQNVTFMCSRSIGFRSKNWLATESALNSKVGSITPGSLNSVLHMKNNINTIVITTIPSVLPQILTDNRNCIIHKEFHLQNLTSKCYKQSYIHNYRGNRVNKRTC